MTVIASARKLKERRRIGHVLVRALSRFWWAVWLAPEIVGSFDVLRCKMTKAKVQRDALKKKVEIGECQLVRF